MATTPTSLGPVSFFQVVDTSADAAFTPHYVGSVGDVDGDGTDDLVIQMSGPAVEPDWIASEATTFLFGEPAATAIDAATGVRIATDLGLTFPFERPVDLLPDRHGEFDGDGRDDLTVFVDNPGSHDNYRVRSDFEDRDEIVAALGGDGSVGLSTDLSSQSGRLADHVFADWNGDGIDDVVRVARWVGGEAESLVASVAFGGPTPPASVAQPNHNAPFAAPADGIALDLAFAEMGFDEALSKPTLVNSIGDINGDGLEDLAFEVTKERVLGEDGFAVIDFETNLVILHGGTTTAVAINDRTGGYALDFGQVFRDLSGPTGRSANTPLVEGVGDVNDDGFDDFVVVNPNNGYPPPSGGPVDPVSGWLIFGAATRASGTDSGPMAIEDLLALQNTSGGGAVELRSEGKAVVSIGSFMSEGLIEAIGGGDFDDDGIPDIALAKREVGPVGGFSFGAANGGGVHILFGDSDLDTPGRTSIDLDALVPQDGFLIRFADPEARLLGADVQRIAGAPDRLLLGGYDLDVGTPSWTSSLGDQQAWVATFGAVAPDTPPTVTGGQSFSFAELQTAGFVVGTVAATDDIGVTGFAITGGDDSGFFAIDDTGVLTLTEAGAASAANDFETGPNAFSLTVTARDGAGNTGAATVEIAVTDVVDGFNPNNPPVTETALGSGVVMVTTTADVVDGNPAEVSLREAVRWANNQAVPVEIRLGAGTYLLSDAPDFGDIDVRGDVTIVGAGSELTFLDGGSDRVFDADNASLVLADMSLTGQGGPVSALISPQGGAIRAAHSELVLNRVKIMDSVLPENGPADRVDDVGLKEYSFEYELSLGGAIYSTHSTIEIVDSELSGNRATRGGAIYAGVSSIAIDSSTFSENSVYPAAISRADFEKFDAGDLDLSVGNGAAINAFSSEVAIFDTSTDRAPSGTRFVENGVEGFDSSTSGDALTAPLTAARNDYANAMEAVLEATNPAIEYRGDITADPIEMVVLSQPFYVAPGVDFSLADNAVNVTTNATLLSSPPLPVPVVRVPPPVAPLAIAPTAAHFFQPAAADVRAVTSLGAEGASTASVVATAAATDAPQLTLLQSFDLGLADPSALFLAATPLQSLSENEIVLALGGYVLVLRGAGLAFDGDFNALVAGFASIDDLVSRAAGTVTEFVLLESDGVTEVGRVAGAAEPLAAFIGSAAAVGTDATPTVADLFSTPIAQQGSPGPDGLVGTNGGEGLSGGAGDDTIDGRGGDDQVSGGPGADRITLGDGADTLSDTLGDLDGDVIADFSGEDGIVVEGVLFRRSDMTVTAGSAIFAIDTDGDGVPDTTFRLMGSFGSGDFMAVQTVTDTVISFEEFLPALVERQPVDPGRVNGIVNELYLTGTGRFDYRVTLRDLGHAGYDNVLGAYEVEPDGDIVDVRILFENANANKAASAVVTGVEAGNRLGFFIVQDAADRFARLPDASSFAFVTGGGAPANVADGAAVALAVGGMPVDEIVFHSFAPSLNPDGLQHVLSGVDPGGETITVSFEDLLGGGDRDYEDVGFRVALFEPTEFL